MVAFSDTADFSDRNTPLHLACEENHGSTAIILIEAGADRDRMNQAEKTPEELADKKIRDYIASEV